MQLSLNFLLFLKKVAKEEETQVCEGESEQLGETKKPNREKAVAVVIEGVRLLVKQAHICGFNAPLPP